MGVSVSDRECQFLYVSPGAGTFHLRDYIFKLCDILQVPICVSDAQIVDKDCLRDIDSKLVSFKGEDARFRLLIAGGFLEEQVTILTLHCLTQGYEVFLLKDLVAAKVQHLSMVFDMRLFQAGIVPTTLRQLMYEWMADETDERRRSTIIKLIAELEQLV
jgi:hypothetical protein